MSEQSLAALTQVFARIGVLSFGGPAAQISLMHRELVDERGWMAEREYLSALSFCMMLPGPEAMQLATYAGWRLRGVRGGLIAGGLFVAPGAVIVLGLAMIYAAFGEVPLVAALFRGVQAAVVVIVFEALLRVARRALRGRAQVAVAILAFLGLFVLGLPFPVIVLAAGIWGYLSARGAPPVAVAPVAHGSSLRSLLIWAAVWLAPLAALWLSGARFLTEIGVYFSKLAVLTFGGAYAVLAWMAQAVVEDKGWLSLPQMIDGLGLAETTPGPLILVTEFVAYVAGHGQGGIALGLAAAVVALWMTFAPCFLWIFVGAPYVQRIAAAPRLSGALSAITAAVVGVIGNLGLWFALHVAFGTVSRREVGPISLIVPDLTSVDPVSVALTALAGGLILWRHLSLPLTLAICGALSVGIALI